jgi:hypothetical protein
MKANEKDHCIAAFVEQALIHDLAASCLHVDCMRVIANTGKACY